MFWGINCYVHPEYIPFFSGKIKQLLVFLLEPNYYIVLTQH